MISCHTKQCYWFYDHFPVLLLYTRSLDFDPRSHTRFIVRELELRRVSPIIMIRHRLLRCVIALSRQHSIALSCLTRQSKLLMGVEPLFAFRFDDDTDSSVCTNTRRTCLPCFSCLNTNRTPTSVVLREEQEIPLLLWNPNVQHHVYKRPPVAPIFTPYPLLA
jgi:hypothetical protein